MINTRLGDYVLTRKLGAGGYGEVWCARHFRQAELQVAIKLVGHALAADPKFVEALTRECVRLDGLDHANIVRFRHLIMENDRVAMVLELLQGEDLQQRLRRGPLSVEAATPIIEAMLEGLGHAHAKGVMHRDVKPSNVFCCDDGRIKLLDFGIARSADNTGATKTGHMLGTMDYAAAERFTGEVGRPASDVYAAGLVFWELLTGKVACPEGEPFRKMGWHFQQGLDATKVRVALPAAPGWVSGVIGALASREAADRPADGAAALALLRRERGRHVPGPVGTGRRPLPEEVEAPEVKRARLEAARKVGEEVERARVEAARKAADERERARAVAARAAAGEQRKAAEAKRLADAKAADDAARAAAARVEAEKHVATEGPVVAPRRSPPRALMIGGASVGMVVAAGGVLLVVGVVGALAVQAWTLNSTFDEIGSSLEAATTPAPPVAPPAPAVVGADWSSPSLGLMKWIPAGPFTMGSPDTQDGHQADEAEHSVTLARGFWLMEHEVTQGEWVAVRGSNPVATGRDHWIEDGDPCAPAGVGNDRPVVCVSWDDVQSFAAKVGARDGVLYRLPSEAEWERAARGGRSDETYSGAGEAELCTVANVGNAARVGEYVGMGYQEGLFQGKVGLPLPSACDDRFTALAPVKSFRPNAYGLHDMTGNANEWVQDSYGDVYGGAPADGSARDEGGTVRVQRGGGWLSSGRHQSVAMRGRGDATDRMKDLGFRLAMSIVP